MGIYKISFGGLHAPVHSDLDVAKASSELELKYYLCPNEDCRFLEVIVRPVGNGYENMNQVSIQPTMNSIDLPAEINKFIKNDLIEASKISNISPRASIVLARRALHSMIRDVFSITKQNDLIVDISALQDYFHTNLVNQQDIDTLHKVRIIGNDGAHGPLHLKTQVDITNEDSQLVLDFILFFVNKWYIEPKRHNLNLENLEILKTKLKS